MFRSVIVDGARYGSAKWRTPLSPYSRLVGVSATRDPIYED